MQAAGTDVSMCNLVVSRQCITPGTEGVYTAGCLVGCFPRLSGDAERKRSFVGVESEKERRSPVVRALRSCYDRILFDNYSLSKLKTIKTFSPAPFSTSNLRRPPSGVASLTWLMTAEKTTLLPRFSLVYEMRVLSTTPCSL